MTGLRFVALATVFLIAVGMLVGCDSTGPGSTTFSGTAGDFLPLAGAVRVDRMGMPAIGTVVITSKDSYNAADPTDDAAGTFVAEITANVGGLHTALDDDLTGLGLTPCVTAACVGQAAPFVVPDHVTLDPGTASGFPNGRTLTDPVIDVTLALILLDLGTHGVTDLVGALNPTVNDVSFLADFPFLAEPH